MGKMTKKEIMMIILDRCYDLLDPSFKKLWRLSFYNDGFCDPQSIIVVNISIPTIDCKANCNVRFDIREADIVSSTHPKNLVINTVVYYINKLLIERENENSKKISDKNKEGKDRAKSILGLKRQRNT